MFGWVAKEKRILRACPASLGLFTGLILLGGSTLNAAELVEVPMGVAPTMSTVGIFIAEEKGFFKEQGIKAVINPFKASGAKMVPFWRRRP